VSYGGAHFAPQSDARKVAQCMNISHPGTERVNKTEIKPLCTYCL